MPGCHEEREGGAGISSLNEKVTPASRRTSLPRRSIGAKLLLLQGETLPTHCSVACFVLLQHTALNTIRSHDVCCRTADSVMSCYVCTLRKRAYFELDVAGERAGRIEVELATDILPVTCRNFLELCAGTGKLPDGTPLTYKVKQKLQARPAQLHSSFICLRFTCVLLFVNLLAQQQSLSSCVY
jgi:Cyclophilin type peptidyl-prolyl cis-trans isomerase/CLD